MSTLADPSASSPLGFAVALDDGRDVLARVSQINDLLGRRDIESMLTFFAEGCVVHHPAGTARGKEQLRELAERIPALPDGVRRVRTHMTVHDMPDGSLVVASLSVMVESDREWLQGIPYEAWRDVFTRDVQDGWLVRERWVERADGAPELRRSLD